MSGTRRVFPETFKRKAVDRVTVSGLSVGAVGRGLGLHETVLRRWMMQFRAQATGAARRSTTQASAPSPSDLAGGRQPDDSPSAWAMTRLRQIGRLDGGAVTPTK